MCVEKLKSRIIKYRLFEEETRGVLYYTLDLDRYSLSIGGETSADYKWVETPKTESFIKLMLRCDSGYLMNKLFRKVFDLEKSVKATKEFLESEEWFYRYKDKKECLKEIDDISVDSEREFIREVIELLNEYDVVVDGDMEYELWGCIEKSYKHWDEKAIDLFCEYIKPELKKELKGERE